jgi:hypothetical protein
MSEPSERPQDEAPRQRYVERYVEVPDDYLFQKPGEDYTDWRWRVDAADESCWEGLLLI